MRGLDHVLVRTVGWPATVLHGDPCLFDRWLWVRRHLRPGPLRTLDAGSGSGAFALYAARRGNEVVGISFDARNNEAARERARILGIESATFVDGDLRRLGELAETWEPFDQVLCLETIEHIVEDERLVRDLAGLLAPGGRLLLTTPSDRHRRMLGDDNALNTDGGHARWGYSHADLRALLESAHLRVVREDFVSGLVSQQLTNVQRAACTLIGRAGAAVTLPVRPLALLDRPLTAALGYPYLCVAVVAERPSENGRG